jgi:hypothetical protein
MSPAGLPLLLARYQEMKCLAVVAEQVEGAEAVVDSLYRDTLQLLTRIRVSIIVALRDHITVRQMTNSGHPSTSLVIERPCGLLVWRGSTNEHRDSVCKY